MISAQRQQETLKNLMSPTKSTLPMGDTFLTYDWREKLKLPLGLCENGSSLAPAFQKHQIRCPPTPGGWLYETIKSAGRCRRCSLCEWTLWKFVPGQGSWVGGCSRAACTFVRIENTNEKHVGSKLEDNL